MALVVIGGNAAGLSAASRARRLDPQLEIVVLERGPVVSYGACGLPFLLEGRVARPEDLIVHTPEYFRRERKLDVRTGADVAAIGHPRREVELASGVRIRYDRLIVATGARGTPPAIPGAQLPHVFTLHSLDDAARLLEFLRLQRPRNAVIVGAGYIGIEAADALRRNGLRVTVLERSPFALLRHDEEFTASVRRQLERHGVELRTGVTVDAIEPGSVAGVAADLVVLATGFAPNVELARAAGIEIGRSGAIRTDDHMETNVRGVFAAGDCAETTHLVSGRPVWIPLGTTANKAGRVAGACAAGGRERFPGIAGTSIVSVFGTAFATTGLSAAEARSEGFAPVTARIEALSRPRYFGGTPGRVELVADRNSRRLLGASVIGDASAAGSINVLATALHNRMRADDLDQLDLAYSPPFAPVWDPILIAAQQLLKQF
jgi:CoA-dependent NAD(P)H sulfur oxidoreductase